MNGNGNSTAQNTPPRAAPGTAEAETEGGAVGGTDVRHIRLVHTAAELRASTAGLRASAAGSGAGAPGERAVVMTMGALHAGHASLIRTARERVGRQGQVVVTVFVNPLQFGPSEDLDRYPRTLDADLAVAEEAGADVVFAPSVEEVYPEYAASNGSRTAGRNQGEDGPQVRVSAGPMGDRFEGAYRPGHFDGVLTVVAKLLHLTAPDVSLYGQKDAQQLALIRRMVTDLNFPVEIIGVPTVRESDGMALSSRNRYLSPEERTSALALSRALFAARDALTDGADAALAAARAVLDEAARREPPLHVDYLALIDPADFTELTERAGQSGSPPRTGAETHGPEGVLAVAARVGGTRLIDNIPLGPLR
ncbi:pantoate--beta-alanine ligase [Streptomyces sp. WMMB 322]|uniref:pantoate--beta-alanine ligase n=1 Tax=Streptomyces sp. WMMB 322 TaxID=1286821 RepID=UPI0008237B9B|nr:pantoate--beta-alanine ligase [Streptomyces sp. WMMB 322]SCK58239.1 pantoate--beta-alanine ligase [Streptomyces sp. WMMB 322]